MQPVYHFCLYLKGKTQGYWERLISIGLCKEYVDLEYEAADETTYNRPKGTGVS